MRFEPWMLLGLFFVGAGCAGDAGDALPATSEPAAPPATRPTDPALLSLDQIQPKPVLPNASPATNPSAHAPLQAIQLYAQARAAQIQGNAPKAMALLQQAITHDPQSFELNYALGQAHLGVAPAGEPAIQALQRAAAIRPDHLDVHLLLGKQYTARGDLTQAIEHLRLATQTSDYRTRAEGAALVNLFLARALQQKGYDTAALEQYELLMKRLEGHLNLRSAPELYFLASRPEMILIQIGQLNEKHGRYALALESYNKACQREPDDFGFRAHVVRALLGLGQTHEAQKLAAKLVGAHRASNESVSLLKEAYKSTGHENAAADALRAILKDRPDDRSITFGLADVLSTSGRAQEAENLLGQTLTRNPQDLSVASRLFELYADRDDTEGATRIVVQTLARREDSLEVMQRSWARLIRPSTRNRLRLPMIQRLQVPSDDQGAKLFLIAQLAEATGRQSLSRATLEQAVAMRPPFGPAYRELLADHLQREDSSEQQKADAAEKLVTQASERGRPELAAELRGLLCLHQKKASEAVAAFNEAVRLGNKSPGMQYQLATALLAVGRQQQAETLLWKIVQDHSTYDDAYLRLFRICLDAGQGQQALKVLQTWLSADPFSVNARLVQVNVFTQAGRLDVAEAALLNLFRDESEYPLVLAEMNRFYARSGRTETFISKLEDERAKRPGNQAVVDALLSTYVEQGRMPDAVRVVDGMRAAAGRDTDQLYLLAHLYDRAGQRTAAEDVLKEVLRIEPQNGPANNDLGYMWADDGKNLPEAEAMIRTAVAVEPDNAAYMDSLGWVLYKRGKFQESRRYLDAAVNAAGKADPVVLDHLGDALYRLHQPAEAAKLWQRSLDRLPDMRQDREDLKKLLLLLKEKLQQHRDGRPVNVAPITDTSSEAVQVKN